MTGAALAAELRSSAVRATPYRRDSPRCRPCGSPIELADCYLSWHGELLCDQCFHTQPPPSPPPDAPPEALAFEPRFRKEAQAAHLIAKKWVPLVWLLCAVGTFAGLALSR